MLTENLHFVTLRESFHAFLSVLSYLQFDGLNYNEHERVTQLVIDRGTIGT